MLSLKGFASFFYNNCCIWLIKIIKREGIGFYLQPTQPSLDSHSNESRVQPILMPIIASLENPPTIGPTGLKSNQIHRD